MGGFSSAVGRGFPGRGKSNRSGSGFESVRLPDVPSLLQKNLRYGSKPCPFKTAAPGECLRQHAQSMQLLAAAVRSSLRSISQLTKTYSDPRGRISGLSCRLLSPELKARDIDVTLHTGRSWSAKSGGVGAPMINHDISRVGGNVQAVRRRLLSVNVEDDLAG